MFKSKLTWIIVLFLIALLVFGIWRGMPPFQLYSNEFPGLLIKDSRKSENVEVKIYKKTRKLELYNNGEIIGVFRTALGFSPIEDKEIEGDGKTPEGLFTICYINNKTPYIYFFGLNYPNLEDAERGLRQNLISQEQYQEIKRTAGTGEIPLWKTRLGGEVGIHGGGSLYDWTQGCVAVSDADILILKDYLDIGTPVEIFP